MDETRGMQSGPTGLANREKWAAFDPLVDEHADLIRSIRDRVIDNAGAAPGERMLDVGAGTGLIALEARRHAAPAGVVVALDMSEGALRTCRKRAAETRVPGVPLHVVAGEALRLPFRDSVFDMATGRSVLMYVEDKPAAARELYRVLRPGGRASVYEPINRHMTPARWYEVLDGAALPPGYAEVHEQIAAELRARRHRESPDRALAIAFDERDLVRAFIAAGFSEVKLTYEYVYTEAQRVETKPVEWYLQRAGYAEIARSLIGDDAEALLARFAGMEVTLPQRGKSAEAYLVAWR
ncbi:MAG: methyltransferase domain-containing protein [Chloroflexi bacterium]|nr:methyltransferase domain-containing protein [Chloroflexota bacterium]